MIKDASSVLLNAQPATLPNVQGAMLDWFQNLTFIQIVKKTVNFNLVEAKTSYSFQGIRQPFTAQQLLMKPEGQRSWKWETIHAFPDLVLKPDDQIIFNKTTYRVKSKSDFAEYGYVMYEICEDYV